MRRLLPILFLHASLAAAQQGKVADLLARQRMVVIMFDGFGMSYYRNAPMPFLKSMTTQGFFKRVQALMPTVTNTNNASICCSDFPAENGITGNSFLDTTGEEEYMERADLLRSPTLFEKLQLLGIPSALISSKKKTIGLLSKGATLALSLELTDSSWIARLGKAPAIYSPEVNYWTMRAALAILEDRPDIRCIYVHTTDYPMHMAPPEDPRSLSHLATMDSLIERITQVAPDAMILITADHDMGHKDRCVDLENTLAARGVKVRIAISVERDKYVKHHRGYGGTSYVYLEDGSDTAVVKSALRRTAGVERVLDRAEAAQEFQLMPTRIGDLVVLADTNTVFGSLENGAQDEALPAEYRTHGSAHERSVPLLIYRAPQLPPAAYFQYNQDLLRWLFD